MPIVRQCIDIRKVHTESDRERISRLRYKAFAEEMKVDLLQKAYAEQKVGDELDDLAEHWAVVSDGEIVGSVRLNTFAWDKRFRAYYQLYSLERFLLSYPLVPIAFFSYLVIHRDYRHSSALEKLLKTCRAAIREKQSGLVFCHCPPEWAESFEALGFRPYKGNVYLKGMGMQTPLVMNGGLPI